MKTLLAFTLAALLCSVQCGPFTAHISTKWEYHVGEEVECIINITNTDSRDYHLLARNTPLEGLRTDIFSVSNSYGRISYDSILVKRGPPSRDEHILIKAKSSLVSSVDLSEAYSFDSAGAYMVQLEMELHFYQDGITIQHVLSNTVEFFLTESQNKPRMTHGALARLNMTLTDSMIVGSPLQPKIRGLYDNQQDRHDTIRSYKIAYSAIKKSIPATTGYRDLYKEWFGIPYRQIVTQNYEEVKKSMETTQFTLYGHGTKCDPGDFAYTYHYTVIIYLCDGYFSASMTGTDSKMGTIVHEMSHAVVATNDIAYGQSSCRRLAYNHPDQAINNADNYEYFSESS